jgi:ACS family hexuronate transporter-like MFS transporter
MTRNPLRWFAICVFLIASMLNYLDRSLLAALSPTIEATFHFDDVQYGWLQSAFAIPYALMAPMAGMFIDSVGLNIGAAIAVAAWSCVGAITGLATSFRTLLGCRMALGVTEAGGIPLFGKANALYLEPDERTIGHAMNQVGLSLGGTLAPLIAAGLAPRFGWQSPFILCGGLGLLWVPVWLLVAKKTPPKALPAAEPGAPSLKDMARDKRVWGLALATVFIMSLYLLWTTWTTLYFVRAWHMSATDANQKFAWMPPVFGTLGGFFGGWLSFRFIRAGSDPIPARMKVCWLSAVLLSLTATIPLMPTRGLAAACVSMSFFWAVCLSANLYVLPIDMFGPRRAAVGVAILTSSYGWLQAFASPIIGETVKHFGFNTVCVTMSLLPLVGVGILRVTTNPPRRLPA